MPGAMPRRGYWLPPVCVEPDEMFVPKVFAYVFECAGFVKIGISRDVEKRRRGVQACCPWDVTLFYKVSVFAHVASEIEHAAHCALAAHHHRDEWFQCPADLAKRTLRNAAERHRYAPAPEGWKVPPALSDDIAPPAPKGLGRVRYIER